MELKLVNENKLKIILTNEDMVQLDINPEEMDYDNTGTKRIFWDILDKAKHQIGFDAGAEKLFVQVYPDKNGGCLMYVTKDAQKNNPYIYEKKYKSKLYTGVKKKRVLYMFEDSEILLEACYQLNLTGYKGKSDIFTDETKYYLYIDYNKETSVELLSEYGILINNPLFEFYLYEHAQKIISSEAVKIFSEMLKKT